MIAVSELAISMILEQLDPFGAFHLITYEYRVSQPRNNHARPISWNIKLWSTANSLSTSTSWTTLLSFAGKMQNTQHVNVALHSIERNSAVCEPISMV